MKILVAAIAIALLVPAGAIADIPDQSRPDIGPSRPVGMPPHLSGSHPSALGTDVAASDQQSPVQRPAGAVAPSPAADASGFEWDDAAVGAAAAITLVAMTGVAGTALRRRRRASALAS
jgi:hypothetical protein